MKKVYILLDCISWLFPDARRGKFSESTTRHHVTTKLRQLGESRSLRLDEVALGALNRYSSALATLNWVGAIGTVALCLAGATGRHALQTCKCRAKRDAKVLGDTTGCLTQTGAGDGLEGFLGV